MTTPTAQGPTATGRGRRTSRALFREFLNQNPHLATARPLRTMHCLEQLVSGSRGRHKGIAGVCQDPLRQSAFDHWAAVQTEDRQVLVLSHPYGGPEFTELRLPDPATITQDSYGLFRIPRDTREGGPDYPHILGARSWGQRRGPADKGPAGPGGKGRWDRPLLVPAGQDLPHGDRQEGRPGEPQPGLPGRRSGMRPQEMRRVRSMDCRPVAEGECVYCPGSGLRGPQARRQPAEMVG